MGQSIKINEIVVYENRCEDLSFLEPKTPGTPIREHSLRSPINPRTTEEIGKVATKKGFSKISENTRGCKKGSKEHAQACPRPLNQIRKSHNEC